MTSLNLIFSASFFVFIVTLIGAVASYFDKRWKTLLWMMLGVMLSGACTFVILYTWLTPPSPHELPVVLRNPPVAL